MEGKNVCMFERDRQRERERVREREREMVEGRKQKVCIMLRSRLSGKLRI